MSIRQTLVGLRLSAMLEAPHSELAGLAGFFMAVVVPIDHRTEKNTVAGQFPGGRLRDYSQ